MAIVHVHAFESVQPSGAGFTHTGAFKWWFDDPVVNWARASFEDAVMEHRPNEGHYLFSVVIPEKAHNDEIEGWIGENLAELCDLASRSQISKSFVGPIMKQYNDRVVNIAG